MFESIRKHSKIVMVLLFLLIIPSFVLVGVERYAENGGKENVVAKVDGQDITQGEWDAAHSRQVENVRAQMPSIDIRRLETPEARYASLEQLVRSRVVAAALEKSRVRASDTKVSQAMREYPELASAINPDGSLDMVKFRSLVAPGVTPQALRESIRSELSLRQFAQGVAGSTFAAPAQAAVAMDALFAQREVQVAFFKNADFAAKAEPTDADIQAYYQANLPEFQRGEKADIEYVVLSLENVQKAIVPTEQELKTAYDTYVSGLASNEERRASHILVAAAKDAPAAEREKAKARAQELLDAVRKNPSIFAETAKKNSADTGSAANGGDLDFFRRGAMVKPFEDTAFNLKKGEISDIVETEFGFHILQLTDIRKPAQKTFDAMRAELETSVRQQRAPARFAEVAESFSNDVYEQSDSLRPVAERLKLPVLTASVARIPGPGQTGMLANDKLLEAVFAPDAVQQKRNTRAIDVGTNQLVSARVVQHSPARAATLDEVRATVRERLVAQQTAVLARQEGQAKLAAWTAEPGKASLPAAVVVSRKDPQSQPQPVVDAALRVTPAAQPVFTGVDVPGQGYAVVKVNKAIPAAADTSELQRQQQAQYGSWWGSAEDEAYYRVLYERFKAQIKAPKPDSRRTAEAAVARG